MNDRDEISAALRQKIEGRSAKVVVVGLGYAGLPLAVALAKAGYEVTGVEISPEKVSLIEAGRSDVQGVSDLDVAELNALGKLTATLEYDATGRSDVIVVCVPTPLNKTRDPDVSHIVDAFTQISKHVRRGQLVILESTTYPGTTEEVVLPLLKESTLEVGEDFFLAFSPERVDPGNQVYTLENTPKVVGGVTDACSDMAKAFYEQVISELVPVSSTRAAEMVKMLENTFRSVNIALVNEVALMCGRLGVDVWEVIDAAASKPFGFIPFYPGPGLGGHCIPVDPHLLAWKLRTLNFHSRFIELSGEITRSMPVYVVSKIGDALNRFEKSINGSSVLVLGVTYKPDVDDIRESPALDIIEALQEKGANVSYHDPFVEALSLETLSMKSVALSEKLIAAADCVVITADHSSYDFSWIVKHAPCIVDTRNATKGISDAGRKVVKL